MEEKQFVPRHPDYKGYIEIAGWVYQDESGNPEIKIRLGRSAVLKKHVPKPNKPTQL